MRFLRLLWKCFTEWNAHPTSLEGAQAILAHAAGENSPTDPGIENKYLSSIIKDLYYKYKVPVFAQGELAPCLSDIPISGKSLRQSESKSYISTFNIAEWQKTECDKIGAKKVILVSYLPHYWRAKKVTEKMGLEVLVPPGIAEIYDSNNSQIWARYKWLNRPYEILARLMFVFKGWI